MERTAECVTPMHPDKMCDRISDAILDACLKQDANTRAAIETMGGHGIVTITGELTTSAYVDIQAIAKKIVGKNYGIQVNIIKQSQEIANGVDAGGAGDQGIMVGYACSNNEEMMPQEYYLARKLCRYVFSEFPFDGKTQITMDGDKITTVVCSFQNVKKESLELKVNAWLNLVGVNYQLVKHINPAGDWSIGGFDADTGLTGRKIVVDSYGAKVPIGGGCFSGKDATKVDRSGAYLARCMAVRALKFNNAKEVFCYLAYAIGVPHPVQATLIIDGHCQEIKNLDLATPNNIIKTFGLKNPIFEKTAEWGHFGNNFKWDTICLNSEK